MRQIISFLGYVIALAALSLMVLGESQLKPSENDNSRISIFAIICSIYTIFVVVLNKFIQQFKSVWLCNLAIILNTLLLSFTLITLTTTVLYQELSAKFLSNEISILWKLKSSSSLHRRVIGIIQSTADCCKMHTLVSDSRLLIEKRNW